MILVPTEPLRLVSAEQVRKTVTYTVCEDWNDYGTVRCYGGKVQSCVVYGLLYRPGAL